jgi:hypothetical protein
MYIAQRRALVRGMAGIGWAQEITKVVQDAGLATSLWAGGPGTVPGSVAWSTFVESLAELSDAVDSLMANTEYARLADAGRDHVQEMAMDRALRVVHGDLQGRAEVGNVVATITALVNPERADEAMAFGASIVDVFTATTGARGAFTAVAAGTMGEVMWIARYDDYRGADAAEAKAAASADYAAELAKGAGLFTQGVSAYARRIG